MWHPCSLLLFQIVQIFQDALFNIRSYDLVSIIVSIEMWISENFCLIWVKMCMKLISSDRFSYRSYWWSSRLFCNRFETFHPFSPRDRKSPDPGSAANLPRPDLWGPLRCLATCHVPLVSDRPVLKTAARVQTSLHILTILGVLLDRQPAPPSWLSSNSISSRVLGLVWPAESEPELSGLCVSCHF